MHRSCTARTLEAKTKEIICIIEKDLKRMILDVVRWRVYAM